MNGGGQTQTCVLVILVNLFEQTSQEISSQGPTVMGGFWSLKSTLHVKTIIHCASVHTFKVIWTEQSKISSAKSTPEDLIVKTRRIDQLTHQVLI